MADDISDDSGPKRVEEFDQLMNTMMRNSVNEALESPAVAQMIAEIVDRKVEERMATLVSQVLSLVDQRMSQHPSQALVPLSQPAGPGTVALYNPQEDENFRLLQANPILRQILWLTAFGNNTHTGEVFAWPFEIEDRLCMVICLPLLRSYYRVRYQERFKELLGKSPAKKINTDAAKLGNVVSADGDYSRFLSFFPLVSYRRESNNSFAFITVDCIRFWSLLQCLITNFEAPFDPAQFNLEGKYVWYMNANRTEKYDVQSVIKYVKNGQQLCKDAVLRAAKDIARERSSPYEPTQSLVDSIVEQLSVQPEFQYNPMQDTVGPTQLAWRMSTSAQILTREAPVLKKFFSLAQHFPSLVQENICYVGDVLDPTPMHIVDGRLVVPDHIRHPCYHWYQSFMLLQQVIGDSHYGDMYIRTNLDPSTAKTPAPKGRKPKERDPHDSLPHISEKEVKQLLGAPDQSIPAVVRLMSCFDANRDVEQMISHDQSDVSALDANFETMIAQLDSSLVAAAEQPATICQVEDYLMGPDPVVVPMTIPEPTPFAAVTEKPNIAMHRVKSKSPDPIQSLRRVSSSTPKMTRRASKRSQTKGSGLCRPKSLPHMRFVKLDCDDEDV